MSQSDATFLGRLAAFVGALRPLHWIKNALVFAAPTAAGSILDPNIAGRVGISFGAFCAIASAVYLANDVADVEADRVHPKKRFRPIAARQISIGLALTAAAVLTIVGLWLGWSINAGVFGLLLTYLFVSLAYSAGLKRVAVVELLLVASGFVIRAGVGASAAAVPISTHFLTVTAFGALAVIAGKRGSELARGGSSHSRSVLAAYSVSFLGQVRTIAAGGTLIAYSLWAFEQAAIRPSSSPWLALSVVPFVLALLRYLLAADHGRGEAPEALLFQDRVITLAALSWCVLFLVGVGL